MNVIMASLKEYYEYRNVLRSLLAKNLYGRYKNSFLGFAWNFVTPLILMLMYYIIFTEVKGEGAIENKWMFLSSAIFAFHFLTSCIVGGTNAFTGNAGMIKKMYFPREILVFSKVLSSFIVCLIGYLFVFILIIGTSYPLDWSYVVYFPLMLLLMLLFGIGCVFFLSSITVYVRDIQYVLGSMSIAFFVLTPMRYMAEDAEGLLATIIWINPLTYFVEVFHDILYWGTAPDQFYILMCIALAVAFLLLGFVTFRLLKHGFLKRI